MTLVGALLLSVILAACGGGQHSDNVKANWLNKSPCSAPCWENIALGTTTNRDALNIINGNRLIAASSIDSQEVEGITIVGWSFSSGEWKGKLVYSTTDLDSATRSLTLLTPDLCLHDIVATYGDPTKVDIASYRELDYLYLIWEPNGLAYSNKLDSPVQPIDGKICGGGVIYFPPNTPLDKLPGNPAFELADFVPWKGYGDY